MKECVKRELVILYMADRYCIREEEIVDVCLMTSCFEVDYKDKDDEVRRIVTSMWDVIEWIYDIKRV